MSPMEKSSNLFVVVNKDASIPNVFSSLPEPEVKLAS